MALESGTFIDSLNVANPASTDALAQADDHLRLIKSTIKATFPTWPELSLTHAEISRAQWVSPAIYLRPRERVCSLLATQRPQVGPLKPITTRPCGWSMVQLH